MKDLFAMKDVFEDTDAGPSGGAIGARFLDRLVATTRGRAFLLSFLASTEEADEGLVFDELRKRVDDEELHKMVARHAADEERHASILKKRVSELGYDVSVMPAELRVVTRLDKLLGGFADRFIQKDLGVMETYLLLLVLEERAVREWPSIVKAFAKVDPASAEVVASIIEDEKRHVKYARAIATRYAPSRELLSATISRVRAAEQRAFDEHTQVFTAYVLERGLLHVGSIERFFWRGIAAAGQLRMQRAA
jgi:rubrerythrin